MEGGRVVDRRRGRGRRPAREASARAYLVPGPGEDVKFAQPPPQNNGALPDRVLRRIAAGLGITFEDLTGDYSKVNFSSARMARIAHWELRLRLARAHDHPQFCAGVWGWVMGLAQAFEGWPSIPRRRLARSADADPRARQGSRRVQRTRSDRHDHVEADDPRARDSTRSLSSKRSSGRTRISTRPESSSTWILAGDEQRPEATGDRRVRATSLERPRRRRPARRRRHDAADGRAQLGRLIATS
jgi:hypothetical protein